MTNDSLQQYYLDFEEYQQQLIQDYPQIQFDSDTSTFDNEHENLQTLKQEEIQFQQKILFAIKMEDNKYQYKQIYNYKCELLQNQLLIAFICPVQEESQEPGWLFITYKELIFAKNQDKNETYIDFALYFEVLENNIVFSSFTNNAFYYIKQDYYLQGLIFNNFKLIQEIQEIRNLQKQGKKVQNQQRIEYNKYSQYKFMPYFKKSGKVMDQFYSKMEAKDIKYTPLMAITEFKNQMDFFVVFQKYDLKQSTIYLLLCSFETKQLKTYPIKIDNSQLFFQNFSVQSIQVIPNNIRGEISLYIAVSDRDNPLRFNIVIASIVVQPQQLLIFFKNYQIFDNVIKIAFQDDYLAILQQQKDENDKISIYKINEWNYEMIEYCNLILIGQNNTLDLKIFNLHDEYQNQNKQQDYKNQKQQRQYVLFVQTSTEIIIYQINELPLIFTPNQCIFIQTIYCQSFYNQNTDISNKFQQNNNNIFLIYSQQLQRRVIYVKKYNFLSENFTFINLCFPNEYYDIDTQQCRQCQKQDDNYYYYSDKLNQLNCQKYSHVVLNQLYDNQIQSYQQYQINQIEQNESDQFPIVTLIEGGLNCSLYYSNQFQQYLQFKYYTNQNSQLYSKEQIKNLVYNWIKNQPLYNIAHNVEEQQCEYSCKQKNTQIDYEFKSPYCIESDKIDLFENHCYDLQNCQLCQLQAHCSWIGGICTPQNNYNYQKIKEAQNYLLEQENVFKKKIPAQYQQNYDQYANLQVCDVPSYCPKKNKVIKGRKNKIFLKNYSNKDMIFEDKLVNKYFSKKNIENDLVNIQKYNYCYWDIQTGKLDSYIFIINFGVGFLPQMYNETYYAKLSFCFDDQLHQNSDCSSFETKIIRLENNRTKPIYYSDKFKNVKIYIDFLQDIQINPKFFYISYWPSLLNAQYSLISALLVCLCIIVILFLILFLIKTCLITYFNTYFQEIQYAASRELTDQQVAKLLQNLKKKKVVEIKRYDIQNSAQMFNQQECPICYEEFENDKEIVELFCKHILCVQCFKSLLKYNMTEQCPNCKQQYSKATEIRKQIEQKTQNNKKINQSIQDANYPLVMQNQNQEDLNTTQNFSIEMVQQQENQN